MRFETRVCSCGEPTYECHDRRHTSKLIEVVPTSEVAALIGEMVAVLRRAEQSAAAFGVLLKAQEAGFEILEENK